MDGRSWNSPPSRRGVGVLGQLFDFIDELALLEVLGDNTSVVVDDVVVDGGEPELLEGGGVEEGSIGDDRPVDGVALDLSVELGTVAIEIEGEDLHPARTTARRAALVTGRPRQSVAVKSGMGLPFADFARREALCCRRARSTLFGCLAAMVWQSCCAFA